MYEEIKSNRSLIEDDEIESLKYIITGDKIKIVTCFLYPYLKAELYVDNQKFIDSFNDKEPYDRLTHIFYIDKNLIDDKSEFILTLDEEDEKYYFMFNFSDLSKENPVELLKEYDNQIKIENIEEEKLYDGVIYRHLFCSDKSNSPTHAFMLEINSQKATLYVGTPNDSYESVNVKATVPDMIKAANLNGKDVIAAMNADFFDMFGNYSPSGLCIKNGRLVANPDSKRPFIGVQKNGTPVITDINENPDIVNSLENAAAGIEMIVKNSEIYEWGVLEPFAFVRHPRTAAGIKKDGTIILLEIDGRIPEYSNGASLVDLAKLMLNFGADRAINLDGGGSSVTYTRNNGEYILRSNPADLFRPTEKLIREEFNCLLVIDRKNM